MCDIFSAGFSTPIVCLVIEGGTNTIRAVLGMVSNRNSLVTIFGQWSPYYFKND